MMKNRISILLVLVFTFMIVNIEAAHAAKARVALEGIGAYEEFADKFYELAKEQLGDKVNIILYKGGSLGNQSEVYEMVNLGELEMAIGASAQSTLEPQYRVFDFPYVFADRDHMEKVMNSSIPQELRQQLLDKKGVRTLTIFDAGFRSVANKTRPIVTPENLEGISIRTPEAPFRMKIFKALGATPTPIPYGDLYLSLEQGVVDGLELPLADIYRDSFYEVTDYLSLTNHIYTPCYLIADDEWWQTLPSEVQDGLQQAADQAAEYTRKIGKNYEQEYAKKLAEAGMQVNEIDVDAFRERAKATIWKEEKENIEGLLNRILELEPKN